MLSLLFALVLAACPLHLVQDSVQPRVIADGRQPQAAIDSRGRLWLTYARGKTIWLRSSNDGGETFGEEQKVADVPAMDLGMRRGPRITVVDGALIVTCIAGEQARGRDGDLYLWRSSDEGRTWSQPRQLNSVSGSAREGLQATAAAGKYVAVVWLDMREAGTTLYGAFSSDGGETFTPDRLLYASPDGTVCECCAPQVAVDNRGRIAAMFRNAMSGNRDMYLMKSGDGGRTFTEARQQGEGHWLIQACPMDGGAVAFDGDDVEMVWRREGRLFITREAFEDGSRQPTKESQIGEGENASSAIGPAGSQIVYVVGGSVAHRDNSARELRLSANGEDPVIVLPAGDRPLVFWELEKRIYVCTP